jgi:hypothetical protein
MARDREHPLAVRQWRRVRLSCAEPHCRPQTTIFVCLTSAIPPDKLISTIFEQPRVWRCPGGHPVIFGKAEQQVVSSLE